MKSAGLILSASANAKATPAQKKFAQLCRKIDKLRVELARWQATLPIYQSRVQNELLPAYSELNGLRKQMACTLDEYSEHKTLTKGQRQLLKQFIVELVETLLIDSPDDETLLALYAKHMQQHYGQVLDEQEQEVRGLFADVFGFDLPDDFDSHGQEDFERLQAEQAAQPTRKKTSKQLEKEAQQAQAQAAASLSLREVFRQLAGALHPDRAPDEDERQRRTELMKRVNVAYKKNDLLTLLTLQLEVEQIDPEHIADLSATKLKHFNEVLHAQVKELEQEIREIVFPLQMQTGNSGKLTPARLQQELQFELEDLSMFILDVYQSLADIQSVAGLKQWLKQLAAGY